MDKTKINLGSSEGGKILEAIEPLSAIMFRSKNLRRSEDLVDRYGLDAEDLVAKYVDGVVHIRPHSEKVNSICFDTLPGNGRIEKVYCDGSVKFKIGSYEYHAHTSPASD
ncbi:hypothetical protein HOE04_01100 [archaeon]|jgi:hypothetical protein|nr:hypothetical protein [archaeon]